MYKKAVDLLCSQGKFYINLGLDRISNLLEIIGNPQEKIKVIHVAGTNGKGSVCSMLNNILIKEGYKVGLYTSPHLVNYTERIKINNSEILQNDFAKYVFEICKIADENKIELTEFEILTASCFKYFADNCVDIAIIETGLGGRYDATNVVKNPLASVITSISLDHIDRLGDTIEKIAFEKAGIIKENSFVVVSKFNNGFDVVQKVANEKNTTLFVAQNDVDINYINGINLIDYNGEQIEFSLLGLYQKENVALVLKTIEAIKDRGIAISKEAIKDGFKTVKWSARLEYIKEKNLLIDGAHNPSAAQELLKSLDYYFNNEKRIFIYSTINTKDYKQITDILFQPDDEVYYLDFDYYNAVKYTDFMKIFPQAKNINKSQLNEILNKDGLKILTGSLYMIGEVYSLL